MKDNTCNARPLDGAVLTACLQRDGWKISRLLTFNETEREKENVSCRSTLARMSSRVGQQLDKSEKYVKLETWYICY